MVDFIGVRRRAERIEPGVKYAENEHSDRDAERSAGSAGERYAAEYRRRRRRHDDI
jgi:hypothetical protein